MRMYFRTFLGFMPQKDIPNPVFSGGVKRYYAKEPGTKFLHSDSSNSACGCFGGSYQSCILSKQPDWKKIMSDAIEFMEDYDDIGCFTFTSDGGLFSEQHFVKYDTSDDASKPDTKNFILTEKTDFSAYSGFKNISYYVLFNAKPNMDCGGLNLRAVVFGRDIYSLKCEKGNIIVWGGLERFADFDSKHTFWGVEQNTGKRLSRTDDVMVGLKGGKKIYVASAQ